MKITILLLLTCVLNTIASNSYSQTAKVTLNLKNARIEEVLNSIESKSEYYFLLNQKQVDINRRVDVNMRNTPIKDVLTSIFKDEGISFVVYDRQIILTSKERSLLTEMQQKKITGTITDANTGTPIFGANIQILGTSIGVVADINGKFSLDIPKSGAIIVFSYMGYKQERVTMNGQTVLNIKLVPDITKLDEVVVVGYGTQKKATLTGAVSQIRTSDILTTKSTSVVSDLQGKVAGLQIRQQTAEPGTFSSLVSIRGFGTPLLVIDGVARDGMSDFERLNPEDIENVSVLKDASAAIYGMNSDNGVIIVTTKKGTKGKTRFTYSSFFGTKQPTYMQKSVDAYTYRVMKNEMDKNVGNAPTYSATEIEKWRLGTDPGYQDNNWLDLTLKKFAAQQQHNLSVSGGNDNITYYASLGYVEDKGLLKSNIQDYKKYNFRSNTTAKLAKGLTAKISFSGKTDQNKSPQGSYFWLFKPIIVADRGVGVYDLLNPTHLSNVPSANQNPYALASEDISGYDKWSNFQYQSTVDLTYEVPSVKGLTLGLLGAYDGNINDASNLKKAYYTYDFKTDVPSAPMTSTYQDALTNFYREDLQAQISYKNTFKKDHNFGATLIYEMKKTNQEYLLAKRQYDDLYTHDIIDQGSLTNQLTGGNLTEQAFMSYLGRFNYDYKNKYLIEMTFREDGSYRYAPSKRWAFFPAVSGGWRVSEESFIKKNVPFISNLKIRGSYGMMGADAGNPFQYYSGYTFGGIDGGYVFNNGVLTKGMVPPGVVNDNLTWVKTRTADIGVDLEMWNGKFGFSMDVFQKNRNGLLASRIQSIPNTFGASFPQENLNSDMVKGIEFMVSHKDKIGDFIYGISANLTYSRKYLIHTERQAYSSSMEQWKDVWGNNRVLGREWGYEYSGQYTNIKQYETAPLLGGTNGNSKNLPGSTRITDVNGDGVINANDMLPIFWAGQYQGYATNPPLQYGFSMNASWKGFDFNIVMQGSALFSVFTKVDDVWGYGRNPTLWAKYLDRWHMQDPNADPFDPTTVWIPGKYEALKTSQTGTTDNLITNEWRFDASYLRIKSLEIGYSLPKSLIQKIRLDNVRIYVNAFNLYTFCSKDVRGMDPEREEGSYTADLTYPLLRSFNFGFNINF